MLIYEVNLQIQPSIYAAYRQWLTLHIQQVLQFSGFQKAEVFEYKEADSNSKCLCVHYHVAALENLQHYLDHHATALRQDAIDQFGDKFQANRRILIQAPMSA